MSARTLTEKLLAPRSLGRAAPGSRWERFPVDLLLAHDATFTLGIERIERLGLPIALGPERLLLAADHFAPPSSPERAAILDRYVTFLGARGLPRDQLFRGISHQLAVEDARSVPGALVAGADSHTTMVGALGCFATGFGTTDALAILATGTMCLPVPTSIRVRFTGRVPPWLDGKDAALALLGRLGEDGALGHALEVHDETETGLPMGVRFAVANHAVEAGATNAVWGIDTVTERYLLERDGAAAPVTWPQPDADARYAEELVVDLSRLDPQVARPGSPTDVVPVEAVAGTPITQAFLGSCAGGRAEEIETAARILRGRRVADGVRLVVTPASQRVWERAAASGALGALTAAGALVTNASCGACGGIDKGLLGPGESCVATSNRNAPGRMGDATARIHLAGAATVATAALAGAIVDPRPYLGYVR